MTLFPFSPSGVPFKPSTDPAVTKATEQRPVFRSEDRSVFRSEERQAGVLMDYVRGVPIGDMPALAVGQAPPTAAVMQAVGRSDPVNGRNSIDRQTLGAGAVQKLNNDFGNVQDPLGTYHRFGKIMQTWYAGPQGAGMPQTLTTEQNVGAVVTLENRHRLGEQTRLTYRDSQKQADLRRSGDKGRELRNTLEHIGKNPLDVLTLPQMADVGQKKRGKEAEDAAAAEQAKQLEALSKARAVDLPPPAAVTSAYTSGFSTAF